MKNFLLIVCTITLWLVAVMLLEMDYRINDSEFISVFSPLQWFVLITIVWSIVSTLNVVLLLSPRNLFDTRLQSITIFIDSEKLISAIIPLTQIFILLYLLVHNFNILINKQENQYQKELNEELKKNTVHK